MAPSGTPPETRIARSEGPFVGDLSAELSSNESRDGTTEVVRSSQIWTLGQHTNNGFSSRKTHEYTASVAELRVDPLDFLQNRCRQHFSGHADVVLCLRVAG